MDLTVILGLVIAVSAISIGDIIDGGNPLHIIHIASLIVIFPTTMAAAAVATDGEFVKGAFKNLGMVFKKSPVNLEERIKEIVDLALIARRDGLLSLEKR